MRFNDSPAKRIRMRIGEGNKRSIIANAGSKITTKPCSSPRRKPLNLSTLPPFSWFWCRCNRLPEQNMPLKGIPYTCMIHFILTWCLGRWQRPFFFTLIKTHSATPVLEAWMCKYGIKTSQCTARAKLIPLTVGSTPAPVL